MSTKHIKTYDTAQDVVDKSKKIIGLSLREFIINNKLDLKEIEDKVFQYGKKEKDFLGSW